MAHPRNSHRFIASFLIAAFLVLSLIATSVIRPYVYENAYWITAIGLLLALAIWKYTVRRCVLPSISDQVDDATYAKMRPYAYAYMAIVFGSAVAFFAYAWAAWYFQFDLNWPIAVAFFSLWLIKNEAWAMILPSATGDTDDRRKPGFNPD